MTEKRFTFDEDVNEDYMYEMGVFSDNGKVMETIDILNCLNNLHEENEQLKKILGFLENDNAEDILNVLNSQENRIWELKQENEQLKQFIRQLQNNCGEIVLLNGSGYTKKYIEELLE